MVVSLSGLVSGPAPSFFPSERKQAEQFYFNLCLINITPLMSLLLFPNLLLVPGICKIHVHTLLYLLNQGQLARGNTKEHPRVLPNANLSLIKKPGLHFLIQVCLHFDWSAPAWKIENMHCIRVKGGSCFIYSWSISHILEHEFFCLGHLARSGQY